MSLESVFEKVFGYKGKYIKLCSPGRVNLIGEHTDYNNGFVFPAAINKQIYGIALPREDSIVRVHSSDFGELRCFDISDELKYNAEDKWLNYVKGVVNELKEEYPDVNLKGGDIVFESSIPLNAGLSSSAAFELINCLLFMTINKINMSRRDMALLCQRAENKFVGVNCGIMDQFVVALGKNNSGLFLDCRSLKYEIVNLNLGENYAIVIGNTNKPRQLSDTGYNKRREECEEAVKILGRCAQYNPIESLRNHPIESLRDADPSLLEKSKTLLGDILYRRAKHVIEENERVKKSVEYLKKGDVESFGKLMVKSHNSLRDLYEVSCNELDIMVEEALKLKFVIGSRMTGAGFGGCTVSIVKKNHVMEFINLVGKNYQKRASITPDFYVCEAVEGIRKWD